MATRDDARWSRVSENMLRLAARYGRWCLVLGLVAGLTLPRAAEALRPYLPEMIAALLFLAAFRIGPSAVLGSFRSSLRDLKTVVLFQILAPLSVLAVANASGSIHTIAALAAILVFSAPSVTGSANFAILMDVKADAALRLLMIGTALFPITVLPILFLVPTLDASSVLTAALRLVAVILGAGGAAFLFRSGRWATLTRGQEESLDGASAILLAIVVVALMSAVAPVLRSSPSLFAFWLFFACTLNFLAQLFVWVLLSKGADRSDRAAISIVAGNRNIALFLIALPAEITTDLLIFIGCYQIPMYLTPLIFRKVYARSREV